MVILQRINGETVESEAEELPQATCPDEATVATIRAILFAAFLVGRFGYVYSEAPVVNFAIKADWINEQVYLRGEGLLGILYRPVRMLYETKMRDALLEWDRYWYDVWFDR